LLEIRFPTVNDCAIIDVARRGRRLIKSNEQGGGNMLMRIMPYIATLVCMVALVIVMKLWKGKVLSWGWVGLLMIFLPQAQGLYRPNGTPYILFGLVSTFVGILIFTFDMTRRRKEKV
jgi:hypothetical protein